jgi:hypothetical protein
MWMVLAPDFTLSGGIIPKGNLQVSLKSKDKFLRIAELEGTGLFRFFFLALASVPKKSPDMSRGFFVFVCMLPETLTK